MTTPRAASKFTASGRENLAFFTRLPSREKKYSVAPRKLGAPQVVLGKGGPLQAAAREAGLLQLAAVEEAAGQIRPGKLEAL